MPLEKSAGESASRVSTNFAQRERTSQSFAPCNKEQTSHTQTTLRRNLIRRITIPDSGVASALASKPPKQLPRIPADSKPSGLLAVAIAYSDQPPCTLAPSMPRPLRPLRPRSPQGSPWGAPGEPLPKLVLRCVELPEAGKQRL